VQKAAAAVVKTNKVAVLTKTIADQRKTIADQRKNIADLRKTIAELVKAKKRPLVCPPPPPVAAMPSTEAQKSPTEALGAENSEFSPQPRKKPKRSSEVAQRAALLRAELAKCCEHSRGCHISAYCASDLCFTDPTAERLDDENMKRCLQNPRHRHLCTTCWMSKRRCMLCMPS
jgi:hypothetical protein